MSDRVALRALPVGESAVLVEVASVEQATILYAAARQAELTVTDMVPAARTVLFDGVSDVDALRGWLDALELRHPGPEVPGSAVGPAGQQGGPVVEVPTRYDGADLPDVARRWGMSVAEAVSAHTAVEHRVAFCGFVPGFAYCSGLPADLHVPRLDRPRTQVPPGSVAVAGEFTGVYPGPAPGGWRLLGRTELVLWDPSAPRTPAVLAPGARVRFIAVR